MPVDYEGKNSAEKLLVILEGLRLTKKDNPAATVGDSLVFMTGEGSVAEAVWHLLSISTQVRTSLLRNNSVTDIQPYLGWSKNLTELCAPAVLAGQMGGGEHLFSTQSSTQVLLSICADQLRGLEAVAPDVVLLQELDDATTSLFESIETATEIDISSRRTLLRLIQNVRDAISRYRIYGPEGLRVAVEAMLGGFVSQNHDVAVVAKSSEERRSIFQRVFAVITKTLSKVKPASESASALADALEKFGLLTGPPT